jgi:hypothetical protein
MFAIQASKEIGGTGPNGAYTHPAVIAKLREGALTPAAPSDEMRVRGV